MEIRILKAGTTVVLVMWLAACSMGSLMIHENQSPHPFDVTVSTIVENAKTHGWLVPKTYDFQKSMLRHDQPDPGRVTVIKLCHPAIASSILSDDECKYASAMMPCSISVYEKGDGRTYVASMNMGLMSSMFGGTIGDTLGRVAEEDAEILRFLHE